MMLHGGTHDARGAIAMAFQELAANAGKIGELNVTPDLLRSLIGGLVRRFNTRAQAAFAVEHAGQDFGAYVAEHEAYERSLDIVLRACDVGLKVQRLDRALVATYLFAPDDVIVTVGPDGLVANAAKYVGGAPILGVNPDPLRVDGVLATIAPLGLPAALAATLQRRASVRAVPYCSGGE